MSNTIELEKALSPSPQSPKKRKATTATPDTSKKRRKRDKVDNSAETVEETRISRKEKKKTQKEESSSKFLISSHQAPETEDVELPDAPAEEHSPMIEAALNGGLEDADALALGIVEEVDGSQLQSQQPSCFYEKRLSLQLPIPAISLASSTSSLLSLHLAPLLLTYFPPADGIVLSFSNPVLSATPGHGVNLPLVPPKSKEIPRNPPDETFARCGDGYGVCWVWLTATFLIFKPESGDELKGWTNVTSEGFVGLVSYNYFQTAVGKNRIPKAWVWNGPTGADVRSKKKSRRGRLQGEYDESASPDESGNVNQHKDHPSNEVGLDSGSFVDSDGNQVPATQVFTVVDIEMVPGHERDRWTLQIEGSLLSTEEDAAVVAEERRRFEQIRNYGKSRPATMHSDSGSEGISLMSGALPSNQAVSSE